MFPIQPISTFLFETFATQLVTVITGVLVANVIMGGYRRLKYGGWSVAITKEGKTLLARPISTAKHKLIKDDEADPTVSGNSFLGIALFCILLKECRWIRQALVALLGLASIQ